MVVAVGGGHMIMLTVALEGGITKTGITTAVIIKIEVLVMIGIEVEEIREKIEFDWSIINELELLRLRNLIMIF